jgi:NO-binding membrane sensor protein with MHYT domain
VAEERVADIAPLDVTGTRTMTIGTAGWVIAFVALLPFYSRLRADDRLWWLWTCVAAVVGGLYGMWFCARRERKLRHVSSADDLEFGIAPRIEGQRVVEGGGNRAL